MSLAQNDQVQVYLQHVCAQIKWIDVHEQVKLELLAHIEDCVYEYTAAGMPEKQAIEKAIVRMGDAGVVGKQLHKIHQPRTNWQLLLLVCLLAGMGLFTLYTVQMHVSLSLFTKSVVHVVLGLGVLFGMTRFNYRRLKDYGWHLFAGTIFGFLVLMMVGQMVNGKPYLNLGIVSINYVDVTPVLFTVALAGIFFTKDWSRRDWLVSTILLLIVPNMFYMICNSLSAAIIYTMVFLVLMLLAGVSKKKLAITAAIPVSLFSLVTVTEPYRLARLLTFLDPYTDPLGSGYIYIQSIEAIKSAGLWGQGFNNTVNLPELHTDLIFSYLVYTFGWVGGAVVVLLAIALITIMLGVAKQVKDKFGSLLVAGLTSVLALHFIWHILMTLGCAPISGVGLPFFSYGGSQTVINMAMLGIVLSVYRRKNLLAI